VLIGIQPRGKILSKKIKNLLETNFGIKGIKLGFLDITFFRDDFGRDKKVLNANKTTIDFIIENKTVVLIDDVLYTGRSIRSALDALQSYGRPKSIQLLNLVDRRFSRELPIQPDYCGIQVDSRLNQKVKVNWKENDGEDSVCLFKNKE
jgi:pyrimidine operon attenuation protein/uracil phosphoribosyltransferase